MLAPTPGRSTLQRLWLIITAISVTQAFTVSKHVHVAVTQSSTTVITLDPYESTAASVTVNILSLPSLGTLWALSPNYVNFGYEPAKGSAITSVPHAIPSTHTYRLVYVAPVALEPDFFTYESVGSSASNTGVVTITKTDKIVVSTPFHFDEESWTVETAASTAALWSGTSTGMLSNFIYRGPLTLTLGADNSARWYFQAPSVFYKDYGRLYGGKLEFYMGSFEGDFTANRYPEPINFVTLECSSCASGSGIVVAQRSVNYTGGIRQFSFGLTELPSDGWLIDPQDDTITQWSSPTQCEFFDVLSGLSKIRIYGDVTTEHEVVGIDSVTLKVVTPLATISVLCY